MFAMTEEVVNLALVDQETDVMYTFPSGGVWQQKRPQARYISMVPVIERYGVRMQVASHAVHFSLS